MPYDLYTLLPTSNDNTEIIERYYYPKFGLRDVMFATRVLGREVNASSTQYRTLKSETQQTSGLSRDAFRTSTGNAGEFKPYLQLDGKGAVSYTHLTLPTRLPV